MRILYVDDDPTMTAAVQRMFASEDFQCDARDLGETAVELAKRNKYDIILLDVMLPDIDGYEVIARLRTSGVRTPVLLQSGLVDRENDIDGLWLGASDYLLKPFNKAELFERIQAVLSRSAEGGPLDPVHLSQSSAPANEDRDRRRRHRRFETAQHGRILHNGGIDCLILNMSYGGAALQVLDPNGTCPDSFDLLLQSGASLRCHVRWRFGDKIGVQGEALFPDAVVTDFLKQGEAMPAGAPGPARPEPAPGLPSLRDMVQPPESSAPPAKPAAEPGPEPESQDPAENHGQQEPPVEVKRGKLDDGQVFTVDRGKCLTTEACDCEDLVVEGELRAAARARRLRLGREGRFAGSAEVEAADIRGCYDGDLTVTGRLVIRAGGTVSGTTRYRQIVIEAGGGLMGQVQLLPGEPEDTARLGPQPRDEMLPALAAQV